jgi:hypothetical protein
MKSGDRTCREIQTVSSDARSGFVNVQSMTAVRVWELEEQTEAFYRYDFGFYPSGWIPKCDWQTIADSHFPGCDASLKELVKNSPYYSDWRSAKRAITAAGSQVHFITDGPVWMSTASSFNAGMEQVIRLRQSGERANYFQSSFCDSLTDDSFPP